MRHLFVAFLVVSFTGSAAEAASTNCKSLRSPAARLACYEKQDSKPETGEGTAEGTITWQYNNFVGTKGDVGAKVILVRDPFDSTVSKLDATESKMLSGGFPEDESSANGVYSAEADGFGKFMIDGIPSGSYAVLIFSSKTRPGPDDVMTNSCKEKYGSFFQAFVFALSKAYCTSIKVAPGRTTTVSHDFGNTYI